LLVFALAFSAAHLPADDGRSVAVTWRNPLDADLAGILVRFSTERAPAHPEEGEEGGRFPARPGEPGSFLHQGVRPGETYHYSVFAFDEIPNYSEPAIVSIRILDRAGASPIFPDPRFLALEPNRPNPFNPHTAIRFEIRAPQVVRLDVFDAGGARVARLVDEPRAAGVHVVLWDGRDARGELLPAGVYFHRVATENARLARKMLLIR
jgi:hypothetical protein